jgi:hypothetical protein
VWRSDTKDGEYRRITGFVIPSQGGPSQGAKYSYNDFGAVAGQTCWYKLEDIDYNGKSAFHGPITPKK